jgi:hypothetical protein
MVLRPIIMATVSQVSGYLGSSGATGADRYSATTGRALNGSSTLSNLGYVAGGLYGLSGASAGASAASMGYANAVGALGGDSLGAMIAANGSWSGVGAGASSAAGAGAGAASSVSWIPYVGWAIAALSMANGKYSKGFNNRNLDSKALDTGPERLKTDALKSLGLSDRWANILGGSSRLGSIFGRRNAELTGDATITGTLGDGADSLSLNSDWIQKGGFLRSNKRGTITSALDSGVSESLSAGFGSVKANVAGFVEALGGSAESIKSYSETIKIQLGSDSKKNEEAISKYFADLEKSLFAKAAEGMESFRRPTETASDTVQRLANSLTTVNDVFLALGRSTLTLSAASGDLASQIVDAFGGTQAFSSSVSAYMDAIYTDSEKLAAAQSALSVQFGKLGKSVPTTAAEYRKLVEEQDLTTDAGREMYSSLVQLAPAFATVNEAVGGSVEALQSAGKSIADEIKRIRGATGSKANAGAAFAIATAQARAGDASAAESLPGLSKALIDMAEQTSASAEEFAAVQASTAASLEETLRVLKGLGVTVPGFATGGTFAGGLRLVGENGPELEVTGPSRIFSASQTAGMLGGGASAEEVRALVDEVRAMRQEMQQGHAAIAGNTGRVARVFDRVARDDALMTRTAT